MSTPDVTPLPEPAATLFRAVDAHDQEAFLAVLAPDAVVDDWGTLLRGREEIAAWSTEQFIGSNPTFTPEESHVDGSTVTVVGDWRSQHANGRSSFAVEADGTSVTRLTIREG